MGHWIPKLALMSPGLALRLWTLRLPEMRLVVIMTPGWRPCGSVTTDSMAPPPPAEGGVLVYTAAWAGDSTR